MSEQDPTPRRRQNAPSMISECVGSALETLRADLGDVSDRLLMPLGMLQTFKQEQ